MELNSNRKFDASALIKPMDTLSAGDAVVFDRETSTLRRPQRGEMAHAILPEGARIEPPTAERGAVLEVPEWWWNILMREAELRALINIK